MDHLNRHEAVIRDAPNGELLDHIRALRRYAQALVGSQADADDLVQETLKRALNYLEDGREVRNLRAYLFRILQNTRNDMLRRRGRAGETVAVEDAVLVAPGSGQLDRLALGQVIEALHRLSENHRQILLLVAIEGMSYREIAEIFEVPIGTVMSRLNRARAALRELLDADGLLEFDDEP